MWHLKLLKFTKSAEYKLISISYVIPCFNAGKYLLESVQSVLDQRGAFEIREIIIVDDRSTDETTLEILQSFKTNPLVRILGNVRKKGPAGARNTGIEAVRCDWIAFHDADDLVLPNGLAARVDALSLFPDASWIGADLTDINFDGQGNGLGRIAANLSFYKCLAGAHEHSIPIRLHEPLNLFIEQAPTNMIVPLIRTDAVRSIKGFNESISGQEDLHFYFRLALHYDFIYVPLVVSAYRKHPNNITSSRAKTMRWEISALEDLLRRTEFDTYKMHLKNRLFKVIMALHYAERSEGHFYEGALAAFKALRMVPGDISAFKGGIAALLRRN